MESSKKIKILMCCLGPETHNRGIITVSSMLREAGMEIVYIGNASPEEAINAAIDEDVDVVGISSLSGAHLKLGSAMMEVAKSKGLWGNVVFLIGGVIPPKDISKLKEIGYHAVLPSGSTREEIVSCVLKCSA
ncbi:cobalamin B12-binding domain-containing protein [Desulfotomaculum copahuensis]|uniref:cobalamin B12-binding domain-containing protein n=1 Tax=Desulfotomaculum copahuensis TaxID=1838280 RepID=UPI00098F51B3|nr:cobalamin B12-binding domain-containing protein [Desulfotomaculum copahuensis]